MPTMVNLLWMLGAGVGHACLVVLAVNVLHSRGWRSHRVETITLVGLALIGLASLAIGGWACLVGPERWGPALQGYAALSAAVGWIGLPVVTVQRRRRRPPSGSRVESIPLVLTDDPASRYVGDGPGARLLRLPGNESLRPSLEELTIELTGLEPGLDGLSIVHLTDLHLSPCYDRRFFEDLLDAAAALEPDLVLLTGDIVEHDEAVGWIAPLLGRVRGRFGEYAIVGNHDFRHGEQAVRRGIAEAGYEDVDGLWKSIDAAGATIAVGGTSTPWGPDLSPEGMPAADLRIVLSHAPDPFPRIARWGSVDLMLCGHNHGGQIRLPLIGSILVPSRYSRRYDMGQFRRGRTWMHVGRGLGGKHPIRWNCPPELTRIVLRSTAARVRSGEPRRRGVRPESVGLGAD
jgi:predicted MPP superfamily phosphohydrolase